MTSAEVHEIKRHFGVVAARISLPIEELSARVDRLDAKLERLNQRMCCGFEEVKVGITGRSLSPSAAVHTI